MEERERKIAERSGSACALGCTEFLRTFPSVGCSTPDREQRAIGGAASNTLSIAFRLERIGKRPFHTPLSSLFPPRFLANFRRGFEIHARVISRGEEKKEKERDSKNSSRTRSRFDRDSERNDEHRRGREGRGTWSLTLIDHPSSKDRISRCIIPLIIGDR